MKRINTGLLAAAVLLTGLTGASPPALAVSDSTTITVSGTVKDNACVLETKTPSFTMPPVNVRDFGGVGTYINAYTIAITLKNCGLGATSVYLSTIGTQDNDLYTFKNTSTESTAASGFGLAMNRSRGSSSFFDTLGLTRDLFALSPGQDNTMEFVVRYKSTSATVTAGHFSTVITMTISYN